jgi:colicin import membrane protein
MTYSLAMEPRDSLFRKMLTYSVAVHALTFLAGALWMALRVPPVLIAPVAVVDLVGGGQFHPPAPRAVPKAPPSSGSVREKAVAAKPKAPPRPAAKEKRAAPPQARSREVSPTESREFSEKIRKMREERATTTQVREAVETIQREKAVRAAVRGIGERVAHRVDLSGVPPQAKGTAKAPPPAGMPGAAGTARVPPEILAYARALDEKVRANWTVPELAQKEAGKLMVQVRITIEKDGRVSNVRMEKVSSNPYFDDSVRRAIQKASPLPIPPEQLRGGEDHYDVGFRFYGGEGNL